MHLSDFGQRFADGIGISELMDDLGSALQQGPSMLMLGGGNPSHIPAVQQLLRERMRRILDQPGAFERAIGNYDSPQGSRPFIQALADLFRREFHWDVGPQHIALTNGSQHGFFALFNLFAGRCAGSRRRVLLPMTPEYIGYADAGIDGPIFVSQRPRIVRLGQHLFKYQVDFNRLPLGHDIAAVCVSRPTNPTGNVLCDDELHRLSALAEHRRIPLIIDNAYGTPFPHILFTDARPLWNEHTIVCLSLSKFGLPGLRTGIVIAAPHLIQTLSRMTAVMCLAPGGLGPALALDLVRSGDITRISRDIIRPYYQDKARRAVDQITAELNGLPVALHQPQGALFLWLWCEGLPITSHQLYHRLKDRGVLVVSGHHFFPGLEPDDWRHRHECIRITYAQDDQTVQRGLSIIADELRTLYAGTLSVAGSLSAKTPHPPQT